MKAVLWVALGGAIGSVARYLVAVIAKEIHTSGFPLGTFIVNIVGCFCIGLLFAWSLQHTSFETIRLLAMIGIIGGFTTFSSFGLETFALIKEHRYLLAGSYVLSSNVLGLLAVYFGYLLFNRLYS